MAPVDPDVIREQNRLRQLARRRKQTDALKSKVIAWVDKTTLATAKQKTGTNTNQELVDELIERIIKEE